MERFHLVVVLGFVVVEEMDSAATWRPPPDYVRVCGLMVAAEVVIDVVKHAVLGKFSDVRPGIYREFHQVKGGGGRERRRAWGQGMGRAWAREWPQGAGS